MLDQQRNHPLTLIRSSIYGLAKHFFGLIFLFLFLKGEFDIIPVIILLLLVSIVISALSWYKTSFSITDNVLISKNGIFNVVKREIPFDKVVTVDISQGVFDRIFNLAKIKIDTGVSTFGKSELSFILAYEKALSLKNTLLPNKQTTPQESQEKNIFVLKFQHLLAFSFISSSLFKGAALAVGFYFFILETSELLNFSIPDDSSLEGAAFNPVVAALLIAGILGFSFLVALVLILLKYSNFSILVKNNKLNVFHGLIAKKSYNFDRSKIRGIHFKQSILMRLTNTYTLELETAGYGDEAGEKAIFFPFCNSKLRDELLGTFLPEFLFSGKINKAPKRSYIRFIRFKLLFSLLISALIIFQFRGSLLSFTSLTLVLVFLLMGHFHFKTSGFGISKNLSYFSRGVFIKKQSIVKTNAIQSAIIYTSFFQRRKKLCTYYVNIWGSISGQHISIRNMDLNIAEEYLFEL